MHVCEHVPQTFNKVKLPLCARMHTTNQQHAAIFGWSLQSFTYIPQLLGHRCNNASIPMKRNQLSTDTLQSGVTVMALIKSSALAFPRIRV